MSDQEAVLAQLGEIQRSVGMLIGTLEAVKEDVRNQADDSIDYREHITSTLNNALNRIAALETGVKEVKLEISKTVRPLVRNNYNWQQRVIGFTAAVSLAGVGVSGLFWLLTGGLDLLIKLIAGLRGAP